MLELKAITSAPKPKPLWQMPQIENIQQGMTRVDLIGGQVHFNSFPVIPDMVTPLHV
jgi:hypothetical protein